MGHTRIYLTALTALMLPAGAGVMTVQASPTCEKFVKTYVSTPVRNRVSKATAVAWAKWREGHPNWKPNPKVTRPRYKMSQREILKKVDFACQVPTDPEALDMAFTPVEVNPPTPKLKEASDVDTTDVTVPDTIPPLVAELPPSERNFLPPQTAAVPFFPATFGGAPVPPVGAPPVQVSTPGVPSTPTGSPNTPTAPGSPSSPDTPSSPGTPIVPETPVAPVSPVPEPSSLVLILTGVGWGGVTRVRRVRRRS